MLESEAHRWFSEYLEAFEACGRGERPARSLLEYWAVPLLIATDHGFTPLVTEDEVVGAAQQQVAAMRDAAYARSHMLGAEVTVLNAVSALYHASLSRQDVDGNEIGRLNLMYLLADGSSGRRISALVLLSDGAPRLPPHRIPRPGGE